MDGLLKCPLFSTAVTTFYTPAHFFLVFCHPSLCLPISPTVLMDDSQKTVNISFNNKGGNCLIGWLFSVAPFFHAQFITVQVLSTNNCRHASIIRVIWAQPIIFTSLHNFSSSLSLGLLIFIWNVFSYWAVGYKLPNSHKNEDYGYCVHNVRCHYFLVLSSSALRRWQDVWGGAG